MFLPSHVWHVVSKHWLGCQAQLLQAKVSLRGEMGTYLGNLCFSFLRLCLVGGTDTRHWAISSYWALVSIMLGQGLGGGSEKEKNTLGLSSLRVGRQGVGTMRHSVVFPTFWACPYPPSCTPGCTSLGFSLQLRGGRRAVDRLPFLGFLSSRRGPGRRQPAAMLLKGKPTRK